MNLTALGPVRTLAVVAVLSLGGLSACGGDDSGDDVGAGGVTTTEAPAGNADGSSVVAQGTAFANDLTVAPGDEFTLDNQDATVHTLTADDGSFDSGSVPGSTQSEPMVAPAESGAYPFHCEIHASMTGTLTVS